MKKRKGPTIPELQQRIKDSFKRWEKLRRRGTTDPFWPDGTNMNLVRNHIFYDQGVLRELCQTENVKPCPIEAKRKPPRRFSENYCAPRSQAGPCRARREAANKRKKR